MTRFLSAVGAVCLAAVLAAPADTDTKPSAADADRLVQQLGAARHADRQAAARALDALGAAALPALREGVKSSDPEVRRRAGELLAKVERQAASAAALAASKIHVRASDTPLAEVVRDLEAQSRVRLLLAREPVDLPARRVTLDTGPTGFWEALDAVCRAARVSVRPGTIDPADGATGEVGVAVPARVPNAAGVPVPFAVAAAPAVLADEPLVLQDGTLPACPTAVLGAVRLRLVPDRWANRDRKPGEEVRWTLEVLTEPRVRWLTRPSFRFDDRPGLRVDVTPQSGAAGPTPAGGRRVTVGGVRTAGRGGAAARGVTRQEVPVYVTADAGTAVSELRGALAGTVQALSGAVATVADVTREKASAATRDGATVTIRGCDRADDGTVTLTVALDRPAGGAVGGNLTHRGSGRWAGGVIPAPVDQLVAGADGPVESLRLADDKGRPYEPTVTKYEVALTNGAVAATLTLECRPPAADARPKVLELHGPRAVPVEAAFTLRGVPAIQ